MLTMKMTLTGRVVFEHDHELRLWRDSLAGWAYALWVEPQLSGIAGAPTELPNEPMTEVSKSVQGFRRSEVGARQIPPG